MRHQREFLYGTDFRYQTNGRRRKLCRAKGRGDDPDVTTGAWIYAKVTYCGNDRKDFRSQADFQSRENLQSLEDSPYVQIDGGIGVGRVTKPGLDQPVGNAAINHVPREMITKEVLEVCRLVDYKGGLAVEIFCTGGGAACGADLQPKTWDQRRDFNSWKQWDRRADEQSGNLRYDPGRAKTEKGRRVCVCGSCTRQLRTGFYEAGLWL